jgi:site-specific DNA-methyltransferase (adenine-specific)
VTPYYADERITLYQGDALAVLKALPSGSVDALITDPPYSSGGMVRSDRAQPGNHRKYSGDAVELRAEFAGDSRDQRGYAFWCALWLGECLRIVKPGGVAVLFTDWRQLPATTDALQSGGWIWRGIVPWYKPNTRPQLGRFTAQCEYAIWGSAGAMTAAEGAGTLDGFVQANPVRDKEHVTQKPIDIMRHLVRIAPGDGVVLDPFMGSGTTGVAAALERRRFIGAELTDHYAEVAERRIRTAAGQALPKGTQDALPFETSA